MNERTSVSRISVSLPEALLKELDWMVEVRGFESRSQAISEMVYQQVSDYKVDLGDEIMAGTINLVYDHSIPGLKKRLSDLQHEYIDEVISSLNVNLLHAQTMEVVLVQGPAKKLKMIADKMIACRGVITGRLLMSTSIIPQVHPLPDAATQS